MNQKVKELQSILYSQALADGVRTTAAILLPAVFFGSLGLINVGLSVSLGALAVSLADAPGPVRHKRNGMLACTVFVFIISFLTSFARQDHLIMGMEIILATFLFTMLSVYGERASAVGNSVILVMILTMDKPVQTSVALEHSLLILAGGLWYLSMSLIFYNLQPYRGAQRSLGDCIREVAAYLSIKADFYNPSIDLEKTYTRLLKQHVTVQGKLDAVREILFKTRQILKESTEEGRRLVWTFVETVDLFEDITATYYDYRSLRKRHGESGILLSISGYIGQIAAELSQVGLSIQMNSAYRSRTDLESMLAGLRSEMDALPRSGNESNLVLKKIFVNLRRVVQRHIEITRYFERKVNFKKDRPSLDHSRFVSGQSFDPKILWNNLSMQSSVFRHSLRIAIACAVGFAVAKILSYGEYSYWILMTIAFILKPAFSLTKQRNLERITGTVAGGFIGLLILIFIPDQNVLLILMVLFMIATYSLMRVHYLGMVIAVTPFVLLLFSFLGMPFLEVAKERVGDTIAGCAIALSASYFLFPTWESEQLLPHIRNMLKANAAYLEKIIEGLKGNKISLLEYKLVRKEVYVSSANLSAAFQRMLSEPKTKQKNSKQVHQFVVLNHILFSNIATLATGILRREPGMYPPQLLVTARNSLKKLKLSLNRIEEKTETVATDGAAEKLPEGPDSLTPDDVLLKDQLYFIQKLTDDIDKTVTVIFSE